MARGRRRLDLAGEALTALSGGALALSLLLVLGLLALLAVNGLAYFWQGDVVVVELADGRKLAGELAGRDTAPPDERTPGAPPAGRIQLKTGNRDITGSDFVWIDEARVTRTTRPAEAVLLERLESHARRRYTRIFIQETFWSAQTMVLQSLIGPTSMSPIPAPIWPGLLCFPTRMAGQGYVTRFFKIIKTMQGNVWNISSHSKPWPARGVCSI